MALGFCQTTGGVCFSCDQLQHKIAVLGPLAIANDRRGEVAVIDPDCVGNAVQVCLAGRAAIVLIGQWTARLGIDGQPHLDRRKELLALVRSQSGKIGPALVRLDRSGLVTTIERPPVRPDHLVWIGKPDDHAAMSPSASQYPQWRRRLAPS